MRLHKLDCGHPPVNERADNRSPVNGATTSCHFRSPIHGASYRQPIALVMGLLLALICCTARNAVADVALSPLFSDNMVLQRNVNVPVWGTGDVGEQVSVAIAGQQLHTTADENGHWMVKLTPLPTGGTLDMTVQGKNTVAVRNIAVGEVWVCSGQSNMEFPVSRGMNAPEETAAANYPMIRMFTVKRTVAEQPRNDVSGRWDVCSPQTVGRFTAVGYFFGRELHKALGVPIGLIHTSWGGTPAEAWTNYAVLAQDPQLKPILTRWDQLLANYPQATQQYEQKLADWQVTADKAKADGKPEPRKPVAPEGADSPHRPASLYNGMIAPLIPYGIKGVIWYQGESNASSAKLYQKLFPTMIQNWRRNWGEGDFPFLFVQLANYMKREDQPSESNWAELREAQTMTLSQPNTAMAVTIDVGEAGNIHPKNKQAVGHRLALAALATTYGQKVEYSGPIYDSMTVEGNKIRLRFKHADKGLALGAPGQAPAEPGQLQGFAIAGADKKFVWANAKIDGDTVVVWNDQVPQPVAVRYGWANNPAANLYNGAGLPTSPFRTDNGQNTPATPSKP